ncbi:glutamine--fructose-6-phosphate transaminase (isomerizing) [Terricaulis silvestris]|uniref:Glutamine--fructose-6-phosphate aminotransferase [isomerizing] n=1 Tax=Terricaulis silvestris TaxID=2686094 RepID=A0A6I6MMJ8_9CAUL|nr:glutamine--fructose-6-phosphate transaminase (isomerizing) [Terricaulis silvestris]QGZ96510.1 Glutamine--fructose-6-phosphate aminotransferase [isomerizing] [Terricaulis silvestris]
MCGIIGILGSTPVAPRLVEALKRLEYRGYDSAGVAALENGAIGRRRAAGKLANLETELAASPLPGVSGIGHTRWATHGAPTTGNAHPHATDKVAIVHNGIIENFRPLREELIKAGHSFASETDSEVIAHLITEYLNKGQSPEQAAIAAVRRLEGAFGIAVLFAGQDDILIGARKGSPLAVGIGDGEMYLGSDAIAVSPFTTRVMFLEEGDIAVLSRAKVKVLDANGMVAERQVHTFAGGAAAVEKGNFRHFMQKEIYEQSETTARTITRYVNANDESVQMPDLDGVDLGADSAIVIGCGTAHYAGRVAEYWMEQYAGIAVETDIASEFRYRKPAFAKKSFAVFVSQSGETADTLAALRYCKEQGLKTLAVVNVPESTIWREADARLPTLAGPEIGVASTKAFTAQLSALAALAIAVGRARGTLSSQEEARLVHALMETPRLIADALKVEPEIEVIAQELAQARDVLYLGRGVHYPIALEGALKLKEISYIHAEGYAAGELKHGPIALIDEHTPVVVVAPHDALFEKTLSNMQEVNARGGKLIVITDAAGAVACAEIAQHIIMVPACDPFVAPLVYSIPIQLLAYLTAVQKGTDVDQPRNLAKSVTVE